MMDSPIHPAEARHVFVSGRVQGVAFRWCAVETAKRLGVGGWVRNLRDGRVEVWAEGPPEAVRALVDWLQHGPPGAQVTGTDISDLMAEGFDAFSVRPTD